MSEKINKSVVFVFIVIGIGMLCLFIINLYEDFTACYPAHYLDYEKSYIKEVFCENGIIHYTLSLCVKNRRPHITRLDRLDLFIYGREGDEKHYDEIQAEIISPSIEKTIYILPFGRRQVECTFDLPDFGAPFSIKNIKRIVDARFSYQ